MTFVFGNWVCFVIQGFLPGSCQGRTHPDAPDFPSASGKALRNSSESGPGRASPAFRRLHSAKPWRHLSREIGTSLILQRTVPTEFQGKPNWAAKNGQRPFPEGFSLPFYRIFVFNYIKRGRWSGKKVSRLVIFSVCVVAFLARRCGVPASTPHSSFVRAWHPKPIPVLSVFPVNLGPFRDSQPGFPLPWAAPFPYILAAIPPSTPLSRGVPPMLS